MSFDEIAAALSHLSQEELVHLRELIDGLIRASDASGESRAKAIESLMAEIKRRFMPGRYIRYLEMSYFTEDLYQAESKLLELAKTPDMPAVQVYEYFLEECYKKIEECDEDGGDITPLFHRLFLEWIRVRQALQLPEEETISQVKQWQERDAYGFCFGIEEDLNKLLPLQGQL